MPAVCADPPGYEDVAGLDVAVNQPVFVGAIEGVGDLLDDGDGLRRPQPSTFANQRGEVDALDVAHRHVQRTVSFPRRRTPG